MKLINQIHESFVEIALQIETRIKRRIALRELLSREDAAISAEILPYQTIEETSRIVDMPIFRSATRAYSESLQKANFINLVSQLEGIGPVLSERLYNEFGSVNELACASPDRLILVEGIGQHRLQIIISKVKKMISSDYLSDSKKEGSLGIAAKGHNML